MKSGMSRETGKLITGKAYLFQRFSDAINTPRGSVVGAREYGSDFYLLIDRNVDDNYRMTAFAHLAEMVANPVNGLDDFKLSEMSIDRVAAGHIEIVLSGRWLVEGKEIIQIDGLVFDEIN